METAIAVVTEITGEVFARTADGSLRSLQPGDELYAGETLVTADSGRVVLDFGNGELATLGPNQSIQMNEQLLGSSEPGTQDNLLTDPSVEAVLAALEGDGDLLDELEAPAAGAEGAPDGGGSSIVQLVRIFESVTPQSFSFEPLSVEPFDAPIGDQDGIIQGDEPDLPGPDTPSFSAAVNQPFLFSGPLNMITAVGETAYSVVGDLDALFEGGRTFNADGRLADVEIFPGLVVNLPDRVQGLSYSDIEASLGLSGGPSLSQYMQSNPSINNITADNVLVEAHDGKYMTSIATLQEGAVAKFDFTFFNGEDRITDLEQGKVDAVMLFVTGPEGTTMEYMLSSADLVVNNGTSVDLSRSGEFIYTANESGEYQFHWLVINGSDTRHDSALVVSQPSFAPDANTANYYNHPVDINVSLDPVAISDGQSLGLMIDGLPPGSLLNYGSEIAPGVWLIDILAEGGDVAGLQLYTPYGYTGSVEFNLIVQSTLNGITESSEQLISFDIDITDNVVQGGTQEGNSPLEGTAENDLIHGYNGDDTIIGGPGNDILFGGLGADTFVWNFGDDGDSDQPAIDIVADFDRSQGDVLNIAELLSYDESAGDNINDFLALEQKDGDMVLNIAPQGNGEVTQSIVLKGVFDDFNGLGTTVEEVVDSLIQTNHIVVE